VAATPGETITSAIVSVLDASGKSALVGSAKSSTKGSTDKAKDKQEPIKAQEKPKDTPSGKKKGEPKRDSDRPGREFTMVSPKKGLRGDSTSPHE
jgi:hypothetical protein